MPSRCCTASSPWSPTAIRTTIPCAWTTTARVPYDMLLTLSGGRSIGLLRQGPVLPTSNLRYRLRSIKRLHSSETPFVTLVLTHADQATRRAIRSLGDPSEHRRTFVATEGETLAGDAKAVVWQQSGSGLGDDPPVRVSPDASLPGIMAWAERLLDSSYPFLRDNPKPNPGGLYLSSVQAAMPEPTDQLIAALAVQLTRADKDALDLLAAWPLCTREQLAGLKPLDHWRRVIPISCVRDWYSLPGRFGIASKEIESCF